MAYAVGQLPAGFDEVTVIPIPTFPGPASIPWDRTWVSLGSDHGVANIRWALYNETAKGWRVGNVLVDSTKGTVGIPVTANDSRVSLQRVAQQPGDTADSVPVGWIVQAVLKA